MARAFSGEPSARWLTETGADRNMILLDEFWFRDARGKLWDAPVDSIVNGASIPRPLWTAVGSPYTGEYRRASIVHDIACDRAGTNASLRRAADRMFFEACREGGCSRWQATVLYVGVRLGAWWNQVKPLGAEDIRISDTEPAETEFRADFRAIAEQVTAHGDSDNPDEVERWTDAAIDAHLATKAMRLEMYQKLEVTSRSS